MESEKVRKYVNFATTPRSSTYSLSISIIVQLIKLLSITNIMNSINDARSITDTYTEIFREPIENWNAFIDTLIFLTTFQPINLATLLCNILHQLIYSKRFRINYLNSYPMKASNSRNSKLTKLQKILFRFEKQTAIKPNANTIKRRLLSWIVIYRLWIFVHFW